MWLWVGWSGKLWEVWKWEVWESEVWWELGFIAGSPWLFPTLLFFEPVFKTFFFTFLL